MSTLDQHARGQAPAGARGDGLFARLPSWLAPRDSERRGRGEQRLIESFILIVVALVLAVATIHDLLREVEIGDRLHADLISWVRYTDPYFHDAYGTYHNPLIEQNATTFTTRDVVCANTADVKPEGTVQVCLIFKGPVRNGYRRAVGGYYLYAAGKDIHEPVLDLPQYSFGCFGAAQSELRPNGKPNCAMASPPKVYDPPLVGGR